MQKMPKIIPITGGLGNQLFQYAYGRKLELIDKKQVIFDTSFFTENTKDTSRPFLLDRFNINPQAKFSAVKKNPVTQFIKKIIQKITGIYPLYQSEKYFLSIKEIILKEFTLKDSTLTQSINLKDSVSIHIRRGDYVNNAHHNLCDLNYYHEAIKYIKSKINNPTFFIFSDDIEWVKENLKIDNAVYVSGSGIKEYEEMILMSQCSHNIIANSTFSWWGAYLNKNYDKIVMAIL